MARGSKETGVFERGFGCSMFSLSSIERMTLVICTMSHFAGTERARANVLCLGTVWTFHLAAVLTCPLASSVIKHQ